MNRTKLMVTLMSMAALAGCATVTSNYVSTSDKTVSAGVSYFLPRQLARVTVGRTLIKLEEATKALLTAKAGLDAANAAVEGLKAGIKEAGDLIADEDTPEAGVTIMQERIATLNAELVEANKALETANTAFTTAKTNLQSAAAPTTPAPGPGAYKVALKIELLAPSADPTQAYVLAPRHTAYRDDQHKLVVSPAGLLTSTNTIANDRTADILVEIAAFAGAVAGDLSRNDPEPLPGVVPHVDPCANVPKEYIGIVDFANSTQVENLNDDLACLGIRAKPQGENWSTVSIPANLPDPEQASVDGIMYRRPVDVVVDIQRCMKAEGTCSTTVDTGWFSTETIALSLPQAGPVSYVAQDSGFPTKSQYTLAFKDGILTDYDASRPSGALEIARTPMRVLNGFFDGVSKIISLRTGQNNNEAALANSETALLGANVALQAAQINGQRTVSEAQLALLRAEAALLTAPTDLERTRLEAEVALLRAQLAAQNIPLEAQRAASAAELALLQQQLLLQGAGITGQTTLTANQLALLQAQAGLVVGANTAVTQLLASNLQVTVAELRDQAKRDALNRCIAQMMAADPDGNIDSCLIGL